MNDTQLSYGIFLSESQLDFLYNYTQGYDRMKCFVTFLRLAVKQPTHCVKGKFEVDLAPGQFAISEVELAKLLECNRKTAAKMAVLFHNAGLVTSVSNSFTTIFTIPCLACWYQGDMQIVSKVYSRHHVATSRTMIVRKNNRSNSNKVVQEPDAAKRDESTELSMSANDSFQVAAPVGTADCQKQNTAEYEEAISNDSHTCAKDAQTEGVPTPSSFDGKTDGEEATVSDNNAQLTHSSIQEPSSTQTDYGFGAKSGEVAVAGAESFDTGVADASPAEIPTEADNAPMVAGNGSTATFFTEG